MKTASFLVLAVALLPGIAAASAPAASLCATGAQQAALARAWAAEAPRLAQVARGAGVSEAAALSGLPPERAVGVPGSAFAAIWKSLQAWPDSVTVIVKGEQVFEVQGRIPAGEPSKVSRYFNLDSRATGIKGHLRPDLYAAIYATSLPGRGRVEHGIQFFDSNGQLVFGIYVPNEYAAADSAVLEAFEATRRFMQSLPRACGLLDRGQ